MVYTCTGVSYTYSYIYNYATYVHIHIHTCIHVYVHVRVHEPIFGGNSPVSLYFVYVRSRPESCCLLCLLLAHSECTLLSLAAMSLHQTYINDPSCIAESPPNRLITSPELFAANSEALIFLVQLRHRRANARGRA